MINNVCNVMVFLLQMKPPPDVVKLYKKVLDQMASYYGARLRGWAIRGEKLQVCNAVWETRMALDI